MSAKAKTAASKPKKLMDDLQTLVAEAEKLLKDSAADVDSASFDALREKFDAARSRVVDLYEEGKDAAVHGVESADEAIRENPYQSLAIGAGIGLLVGLLIGRNGR